MVQLAESTAVKQRGPIFLIFAMILTAMATGMGWGIRGQYGHETGAMMAGALGALTLVLLFIPNICSLKGARAAAMMTAAIGIGGSMTYGQTVGLTHNAEVIGSSEAWNLGMIGLFIKGGLWIGFGGVFFGMGLGGKRYRACEIFLLMAGIFGLMFLGVWLLNRPFDNTEKLLPKLYFSSSWELYPKKEDLKPRPEVWGGYLFSMIGLLAYVRVIKKDILAFRLGLFGILGGGIGFPTGQAIQSYHAWHPDEFTTGKFKEYVEYTRYFNWWNMMETTFGMIWGATIALGLWCNQKLIKVQEASEDVTIPLPVEIFLMGLHIIILINTVFIFLPGRGIWLVAYIQFGLLLATIPIVASVGGRIWPYFMMLVVAVPIMGKTIRHLCYELKENPATAADAVPLSVGWLCFAEIPTAVIMLVATMLTLYSFRNQSTRGFASIALFVTTLLYFGLNTSFFHYSWPWLEEWTGRTPNQLINMVCAICLVLFCLANGALSLKESRNS